MIHHQCYYQRDSEPERLQRLRVKSWLWGFHCQHPNAARKNTELSELSALSEDTEDVH